MTLLADIFMNNIFIYFIRILCERRFLFLFLALTFFCLLASSCGKTPNNIRRLGFCGLSSYGDPEKTLNLHIDYIKSYYAKNNTFPLREQMKKRMSISYKDTLWRYYAYSESEKSFQLAYWTGETTWVYDSKTNIFYEIGSDIDTWFDIDDENYKRPRDVKSINLWR
jgi:hypothetical protein